MLGEGIRKSEKATARRADWVRPSVIWLVLGNLVPALGVLLMGWSAGDLLLLYWVETVIIGVFAILKTVGAGYEPERSPRQLWGRLPRGVFFCVHFGLFNAAHLWFLQTSFDLPAPDVWLAFAVFGLGASHAFSFISNFVRAGEYRTDDESQFMVAPYKRVALMHTVVIGGAFLVEMTGSTTPALLLLVALKLLADVPAHVGEHRRARAKRDSAGETARRKAAAAETRRVLRRARDAAD